MNVIGRIVSFLFVLGLASVNAIAESNARSNALPQTPAYYQSPETVTAQVLFPDCIDPKDAVIREQCSLIASRIDSLEAKLKRLCADAGESISKSVGDVQGVYVHRPSNDQYGYFHEDEGTWELFISPNFGPGYKYWEIDRPWQGTNIQNCRYEIRSNGSMRKDTVTNCRQIIEPESTYGITWSHLTSGADQIEGIFGDELSIFNLKTNETLATRRFYFYVVKDNQLSAGAGKPYLRTPGIRNRFKQFFRVCPSYSPEENDSYVDKRPRNSSGFFSRVLRPKYKFKNDMGAE